MVLKKIFQNLRRFSMASIGKNTSNSVIVRNDWCCLTSFLAPMNPDPVKNPPYSHARMEALRALTYFVDQFGLGTGEHSIFFMQLDVNLGGGTLMEVQVYSSRPAISRLPTTMVTMSRQVEQERVLKANFKLGRIFTRSLFRWDHYVIRRLSQDDDSNEVQYKPICYNFYL